MILIIFEGVDNLGKSTIISKLTEMYKADNDIMYMHFKNPPKGIENPLAYQELSFTQAMSKCSYISNTETMLKNTNKNIVFFDRSHFGEYVYGPIYRNEEPEEIIKTIKRVHNHHALFDVVVIHLEASPEFVISHDDNKSFTSGYDEETRLATVKREIDSFNECFKEVNPSNYIKINVEDDNNNYRNIDNIVQEIISKVKELNIEL